MNNSPKKINISLSWWLDLALYKYGRDYTVIDLDLATQITEVDKDGEVCYLENSSTTLDYSGQPMPQLDNHLVRCWDSTKYRQSFDHHIKLKEQSLKDQQTRVAKVEYLKIMRGELVESFISKGVPESVAAMLVNTTMSNDVVEIAWKQLKGIV